MFQVLQRLLKNPTNIDIEHNRPRTRKVLPLIHLLPPLRQTRILLLPIRPDTPKIYLAHRAYSGDISDGEGTPISDEILSLPILHHLVKSLQPAVDLATLTSLPLLALLLLRL